MTGGLSIARGVAMLVLAGTVVAAAALLWTGGRQSAPSEPPPATRDGPVRVASLAPTPVPTPTPVAMPAPAYVVKRVLPIDGPMKQGDWHWDESNVPAGPGAIVVTVDLAARVLSVFRDGYEIGTTVVAFGDDAKPTPLGVFPVTQKDADHVSNLYGAPMPYMLRMTNDGISIHGSKVGDDRVTYITHGCVGVPVPFARKLFGVVRLGDKVIVSRGETLDVGGAITAA